MRTIRQLYTFLMQRSQGPGFMDQRLMHLRRAGAILLLLGCLMPVQAVAPGALAGTWSGSFTIGPDSQRQLVFHLQETAAGYSARLDLPTQGAAGILADSVKLDGNELTIIIRPVQAEFYGTLRWNEEGTRVERIDGDWNQVAEYVAVTLFPAAPAN